MEVSFSLMLTTMARAMRDVVLPALPEDHKLAREQAQLVLAMLTLMQTQEPLRYRYVRAELAEFCQLADDLRAAAKGCSAAAELCLELEGLSATARALHEKPGAEPQILERCSRALRAATSRLVEAAMRTGGRRQRAQVARCVLSFSRQQTLRERAWLRAQGWETDPDALPDIETLLPSQQTEETLGAGARA